MSPRINFRATDTEFYTPPNDTYLSRVSKVEFKKASTGNNMIEIEHTITAPGTEADGKTLRDFLVLLPTVGWKIKDFLEAFQVAHTAIPGAGKGEFEVDFDSDDILNAVGLIETEQEIYTLFERGTKVPQLEADPDNPGKMRNKTGVRAKIKKYSQFTPQAVQTP